MSPIRLCGFGLLVYALGVCLGDAAAAPASQPLPTSKQSSTTKKAKQKATPKRKAPPSRRPAPRQRKASPKQEDQPIMLGDPSMYKTKKPAKRRTPAGASPKAPRRRKPALPSPSQVQMLPQVDVIGRRPASLDSVPGSADIIDQKTLKSAGAVSASEILRRVPGVNVSDEDGLGLRLNIGFRGLDPVRSRKILVLEDGIPISMAPYGEPEMYYTPSIERMKRLEVVKGSGSILWGPQTIGGVLNFITRDPPKRLLLRADIQYGSFNFFLAQVRVGNTVGALGFLLEAVHKRFEGFNKLNLAVTDVSGKFLVKISPVSTLGIKLHFYDEMSNATYLGLTTPQFYNDPYANHATNDQFPIRRYGLSVTHKHFFGEAGLLQTTLYAHYLTRFWKRQDFARFATAGVDYDRIIDRNNQVVTTAPNDGSALFFLKSTGNRNRAFTVAGVDSRYTVEFTTGPLTSEISTGLRLHSERGDEQYLIGENATSPSGVIRDQEYRTTLAAAAYFQYRFLFLNRKLRIAPGFRAEIISGFRNLFRTRALVPGSAVREIRDVDIKEDTFMWAPIPGLGISYEPTPGLNLFTGIHRGFAPPRTKDSITADGEDLQLEPEFSWNAELGLRYRKDNFLYLQAAGFLLYFENQVIPPSESAGAVDPGNLGQSVINGGETIHAGAEASMMFDLAAMLKAGFRLPLTLNYTWVPLAQFSEGVYKGNRLPYAPEHTFSATLGFRHPLGFNISVTANYISKQYADKGETITPSIDGLIGELPGRFLLDARIGYTFTRNNWSIGGFVSGKNLTNTLYISSRRPSGIRIGTPLQIIGGIHGKY